MGGRSYGQYCGLARALDVVGDRWSLLIVRELLVGPARYRDLAAGLPGVASNLLTERLRSLESAGVVERRLHRERNSVVYSLTAWGQQLEEAVDALVRWSTPLMRAGRGDDAFRGQWLAVALRALLHTNASEIPVAVGLDTADTVMVVRVDDTGVDVVLQPHALPGTVLRADPEVMLGLAAGALTVPQAVARGHFQGDRRELEAVFVNPD